MGPPPTVTGLSPIEGVPGTKLTIRGEFLGSRPEDVVGLLICGIDCLLTVEWKSSTKLIARSGAGVGKGDVIVTTRSGGRGTSTVQFKGYHEVLNAVKECAVWVDESIFLQLSFGRQRPLVVGPALHEDPLGLSVEENVMSELDADLPSLFPGQCGDLSSPHFSPAWFLLEQHRSTGFRDLKAGLQYLERKVNSQKEGQISFLKANVGSVLEQLDTLLELKVAFESDTADTRKRIENLDAAIVKCKTEADKLFEDVLQRKDKADSTRNALNVLHRFRFLLYLPVSIERNMAEGNYDVIINDYARAKSLFGDTHLPIFSQFSAEVERRIDRLRSVLWQELRKFPAPLEHHKKIIRNLQHLETSGDSAWEALISRQSYLLELLTQTKDSHLAKELSDRDHGSGGADDGGGGAGGGTPASKYNQVMALTLGEYQSQAPVRVACVEAACEVVCDQYPELWRLSQAYFGGELLPHDAVLDAARQPQCKSLLLEVITALSYLVRGAVLGVQGLPFPHEGEEKDGHSSATPYYRVWPDVPVSVITPWMPQVIRQVRTCYSSLLSLDLPNEALDIVANLLLDLRAQCLQWLLQQTVHHVRALRWQERWLLEEPDTGSGSAPGHTQLPGLFEAEVVEACQLVREVVLEAGPHETRVLEVEGVRRGLATLLHNVGVAFAQCLEQLCLSDPDDPYDLTSAPPPGLTLHPFRHHHHHHQQQRDKHEGAGGGVDAVGGAEAEAPPGIEKQLLITLSNCAYVKQTVLGRITEALVKIGYPEKEVTEGISRASGSYIELQERLLEAYLEERSDPIIGMIERSMYLGGYDWCRVYHPPTDARTYVKEILMNIAHVQAEVVSVWGGEAAILLVGRVVEGVGEEVCRLLSCVGGGGDWSQHGATQAAIDCEALVFVLRKYMTKPASASFEEARDLLPPLSPEQKKTKTQALANFKREMRLLLDCFIPAAEGPGGEPTA